MVLSKPDLLRYIREGRLVFDPPIDASTTVEQVSIDLRLLVEGRSSYARVGVTVHVTAPKIDPGFDARITLEMANFGSIPVDLRAEIDRPAQLILLRLSTPLGEDDLYGRGAGDTFQGQTEPIPHRS